jgi:hypothetical protein
VYLYQNSFIFKIDFLELENFLNLDIDSYFEGALNKVPEKNVSQITFYNGSKVKFKPNQGEKDFMEGISLSRYI